jgi:hypothetical protein
VLIFHLQASPCKPGPVSSVIEGMTDHHSWPSNVSVIIVIIVIVTKVMLYCYMSDKANRKPSLKVDSTIVLRLLLGVDSKIF